MGIGGSRGVFFLSRSSTTAGSTCLSTAACSAAATGPSSNVRATIGWITVLCTARPAAGYGPQWWAAVVGTVCHRCTAAHNTGLSCFVLGAAGGGCCDAHSNFQSLVAGSL